MSPGSSPGGSVRHSKYARPDTNLPGGAVCQCSSDVDAAYEGKQDKGGSVDLARASVSSLVPAFPIRLRTGTQVEGDRDEHRDSLSRFTRLDLPTGIENPLVRVIRKDLRSRSSGRKWN